MDCLISIELPAVCVYRARMGAQSYPASKDARLIPPRSIERIDSVKINPGNADVECRHSILNLTKLENNIFMTTIILFIIS